MLKDRIRREYAKLRAAGYHAHAALEAARVAISWKRRDAGDTADADADAVNCVRVRFVPDDCADLSYLDQECFAKVRKQVYARADRDGVWGAITEYFDEVEQEWREADSCWGFVGDDWHGSGYDTDMKRAALTERALSVCRWRNLCRHAP